MGLDDLECAIADERVSAALPETILDLRVGMELLLLVLEGAFILGRRLETLEL